MERIPYDAVYIRYKAKDQDGLIKERGSCIWNASHWYSLDEWAIDDLNEDLDQGRIEVLEVLNIKEYFKKKDGLKNA